jgi:hypothetical protein
VPTNLLNLSLWTALVLGAVFAYRLHVRAMTALLEPLAELRAKYRQLGGWHVWFGAYDLETFDGGRSWYAMSNCLDGRRRVMGESEMIFPGLLAELGVEIPKSNLVLFQNPGHALESSSEQENVSAMTKEEVEQRSLSALHDRELARKQARCMRLQPIRARQ